MFAANPESILIGFIFGGGYEWLIVAGLFVLLFGSAKLPSLMRNMGRSVNEFKAGMSDKPEGLEDKSKKEDEEETASEKKEEAGV